MNKPKVLFIDIETAPTLGWAWGLWEQNIVGVKQPWYILSVAWQWEHEKKVNCLGLNDFPSYYRKDKENDERLMEKVHDLLNEADIVIAHNGDNFDLPKLNARFLAHGMLPPMPYKTVDTLKVSRKYFKMDSNRLDSVARYLEIGSKLPHTGFELWERCMTGDKSAWALMKRYNAHDVVLLRGVYKRLLPWITNHPNYGVYMGKDVCRNCGGKHLERRGFAVTTIGRRQKLHCLDCGAWNTSGKTEKMTDIR